MVNNDSSTKSVDDKLSLNVSKKRLIQPLRELIDRLLLERILLAGIASAVQFSAQWLTFLCESEHIPLYHVKSR